MSFFASFLLCGNSYMRALRSTNSIGFHNSTTTVDQHDLVFIHVPYNFGHTIEMTAAFGHGEKALENFMKYIKKMRGVPIGQSYLEKNEFWGSLYPGLQNETSTGCPLYLMPPKYWPTDLATKYFGNKLRFGLLRDPYERLVSFFRGGATGGWKKYAGSYAEWGPTCDVNGAVKHMMEEYLAVRDTNPFIHGCTFLPQAEYFEGDFGIQIAVDNRQFPMSLNQFFYEHGQYNKHIETEDILHVEECQDVWAAALTPETKELVKQVYKKDFDLICSKFHYCNRDENTCIRSVPRMCPQNLTLLDSGSGKNISERFQVLR